MNRSFGATARKATASATTWRHILRLWWNRRGSGGVRTTAVRPPPTLELANHAPLLDAIAASPEDPAPWTVYADLLQTADYPRGELISLMMERERKPSAKLLDAQRMQVRSHAAALAPETLDVAVVRWRRGFASELRLDAPEQLAEIAGDASLGSSSCSSDARDRRLGGLAHGVVRHAHEVVAAHARRERDRDRCGAAVRVRAEPRRLRIVGGEVSWDETQAPCLRQLVLVDADEVGSLDDAELPELETLWLVGDSFAGPALRRSLVWSRLDRVVLPEDDGEESERRARRAGRDADRDDNKETYDNVVRATTAFVIVGRVIEPALVQKIASRMSIAHLSDASRSCAG